MLETVEGDEALGFSISVPQRSITMILPWEKSLRSTRSAGPSGQVLSGLLARIRLICANVFPAHLRLAQIQDLLGLMFTRDPALFTVKNRRQIRHVLHRLIPHSHQYDFFCWCRWWKSSCSSLGLECTSPCFDSWAHVCPILPVFQFHTIKFAVFPLVHCQFCLKYFYGSSIVNHTVITWYVPFV